MAKIIAPNRNYNGIAASVSFRDGVGETDKPHLIQWFREHGYQVEEPLAEEPEPLFKEDGEPPEPEIGDIDVEVLKNMDMDMLKAYAQTKGILMP